MGFTPQQVDQMSAWEFVACKQGYTRSHSPKASSATPMDDSRAAALGIEGF